MTQTLQSIFLSSSTSRYPDFHNFPCLDSIFHIRDSDIFQPDEEIAVLTHRPSAQNHLCRQDFIDILFVFQDKCTCDFFQNDLNVPPETIFLSAFSFCIIPPSVTYSLHYDEGKCQMLHILFRKEPLRSHYSDLISSNNTLLLFFSSILHQNHYWNYLYFPVACTGRLNTLLAEMHEEYRLKNSFSQNVLYYSSGLLFTFMERLHLDRITVSPSNPVKLVRYDQIYSYICDNYAMTSAIEIADYFHISQSYLCKLFHENNTTVTSVIQEIRLQHARSLLERSDLSVQNIAELVGYHDLTYFIKLFKRYNACTPYQYRKNYHSAKTFSQQML